MGSGRGAEPFFGAESLMVRPLKNSNNGNLRVFRGLAYPAPPSMAASTSPSMPQHPQEWGGVVVSFFFF